MNGMHRRLDRLVLVAKPARCRWHAGRCVKTELVGDGSHDPPTPDLPPTCASCGHEVEWQRVILSGVDVSRI